MTMTTSYSQFLAMHRLTPMSVKDLRLALPHHSNAPEAGEGKTQIFKGKPNIKRDRKTDQSKVCLKSACLTSHVRAGVDAALRKLTRGVLVDHVRQS